MKFSGERSFQASAILCLVVITMMMTVSDADSGGGYECYGLHERYMFHGRICSGCYDPLDCDAPPNDRGCYCKECYCRDEDGNCIRDIRCPK